MKASLITVLAALASSAIAAPAGLPVVGEVTKTLQGSSTMESSSSMAASSSGSAAASASPSAGGHVVADAGHGANQLLTVTGPDAKNLLVELSPEVTALLSGLGLSSIGGPVGSIVKTAGGVGDLLKDLGPVVDGLLTVVDKDLGALLIQLSPEVTGLVSGLGLPSVGVPVGSVVKTLGANIKRDGKVVEDAAPKVNQLLQVTGPDAKQLIVQLSPEVAALVSGLGLPGVGASVGSIVKTAGNVGDLLKDLGAPVEQLLTVVGQDGSQLLVQLSPSVAGLLTGLGLPTLGTPVGTVVNTVGQNL